MANSMKRIGLPALALLIWVALTAAPAFGAQRVVSVPSPGPGPAKFDKATVYEVGPQNARRVLVLMPGLDGGAGDFALVAQRLVQEVPNLQVWSVDRRSQPLEDTSMFGKLEAGEATLQETFDYYLGWLVNPAITEHTQFLDANTVPFAREWGMKTTLNDLHRVVHLAGQDGRTVILGGHSLGASLAEAYAAWDFGGQPGYKEINGIVLIDGGLLGTFGSLSLAEAEGAIEALQTSNPFEDLFGLGIPEIFGIQTEMLAYYARLEPQASATTFESFPLLPPPLVFPFEITNRALLGYAVDRDTSFLGRRDFNAGELASSGSPRDWIDGGVSPIANIAYYFGHEPGNALEWYAPKRLTIDWLGADELRMNEVARFLGLRLEHLHEINVPLYAFQTDLTGGRMLEGAQRLIDESRISQRRALLVNGAPDYSHQDPLTAGPENKFLNGLEEFLAEYVKPPTPPPGP